GLVVDRSNVFTLANAISGSGRLEQDGTGTTKINTANTYTGGTGIVAGTLAIGNVAALGTGEGSLGGGELEGRTHLTFANRLHVLDRGTIAAAHGRTFNVGSGGWQVDETFFGAIRFGAPGHDGTVVWSGGGVVMNPRNEQLEVRAGMLKAGDSGLAYLLQNVL